MTIGTIMGGIAVIVALLFAASGRGMARSKDLQVPSSVAEMELPKKASKADIVQPRASMSSTRPNYPRITATARTESGRVWTAEELAQHDGSDQRAALLLAILGEVYDVGPGARFYAPKEGYSHFAGCDNSRAYTSTDDDKSEDANGETQLTKRRCNSKVLDLEGDNIKDILNWREFYRDHKEYRFVGVLHDRYFGPDGVPTLDGQLLEDVRSAGKQAEKLEQEFNKRFMSCNSKHESATKYMDFWCSDGYHPKGSTPVHFYYQLPPKEEKSRCACIPTKERAVATADAGKFEQGAPTYRFVDYADCEKPGQMCRRPKGAKPPI